MGLESDLTLLSSDQRPRELRRRLQSLGVDFWNPEANKLMAESHQRAKTRSYVWSDAQEASKFGTWSVLTDTQAFIGELIDRVAIDQYHTLARIGRLSRGLAGEFARKFVNEPVQK